MSTVFILLALLSLSFTVALPLDDLVSSRMDTECPCTITTPEEAEKQCEHAPSCLVAEAVVDGDPVGTTCCDPPAGLSVEREAVSAVVRSGGHPKCRLIGSYGCSLSKCTKVTGTCEIFHC